ncbi:DUF4225 domain-containing protein [Enterobacter soli]|uniref:DUF4225 domain-containing protein n=1 Tax=Enterobacter soli TaxID=885040 RepID=UPI0034CEEE5D
MGGYIQGRNGNGGILEDIIRSQANFEAGALRQITITASGFINNDEVRYDFIRNVEAFTEAQLECINGNSSRTEKTQALAYLREEQDYLEKQIGWLQSKQVQPAASVEIRIINGVVSYVVKSVGLIGGVLQVVSGSFLILAGSPTVIGSVIGIMLIAHGLNNIYENGNGLFYGNENAIGKMTYLYEETAEFLGFDRVYGKLAFAGIDLTLSAIPLLSVKLLPDAWRLFRYLPSDYTMGFRTMSKMELLAEFFPDAGTLYSGTQILLSLPESEPTSPRHPLIPLSDY